MTLETMWNLVRVCFLGILFVILLFILFCAIVVLIEFMSSVIKQFRKKE